MRTLSKALVLACALAVLTGCGVTGQWKMESIKPEKADEHFQMRWMCLMDDGTYKAAAMDGDQCKMMSGRYTYAAGEKMLTFKTDGKERKYHAEIVGLGDELKVTGSEKGMEWTAMMKRGECCPKDKCTCPEMKDKSCPMHEKKAEVKKEEPKKAEPKKEAPKKEEAKKAEPKKEAPKKEEAKKPEAKKEAPKKEEPKKEPGTPG